MLVILTTILLYLVSIGIFIFLLKVINKTVNKSLLHQICSVNVLIILLWAIFGLINYMLFNFIGYSSCAIYFLSSVTVFFLPSTLVWLSIVLINNQKKHTKTYIFIFMPPVLSTLILATNSCHGLFPGVNSKEHIGPVFLIHCTWQLAFAIFAVCYIVYYSLKYTNGLSKQILLVVTAITLPLSVDVIIYLVSFATKDFNVNIYTQLICYCILASCLTFAIYKYRFLEVVPIAIRSVIDHISDSFVIVDYKYDILEINNVFKDEFGTLIKSSNSLFDLFGNDVFNEFVGQLEPQINSAIKGVSNNKFNYKFIIGDTYKHFTIEVSPIVIKEKLMAVLILFKNITEHMRVLELMEENANQLIETARLTSLNQLIGGIAHNIKSPLMSSSGGVLVLENHTKKVHALFNQLKLYAEYPEYNKILEDMQRWENTIKQYLIYISDIITTVKDQTVSLNKMTNKTFTFKETLDKVRLLMDFELKKSGCSMNQTINIDENIEIEGDITALIQIINNVILNAIQSYEDGGIIELTVSEVSEYNAFIIKDYGKGIEQQIKDKIFNEMVTTKGKDGTGIGLYISNIAVKSHFRGKIDIESEVGKYTKVYVLIPKNN